MTLIKDSIGFTFNGIHSSTYGIWNVNVDSGLIEEQFLPTRSIVEEQTISRKEPYFYGFQYSPIEFTLNLAFFDVFDSTILSNTKKWLMQSYYKPLIFDEYPNVIYYAMVVETPTITHNNAGQGYVTVNFRCNSPYSYSPRTTITSTVESDSTQLTLINDGNLPIRPIVSITKSGLGGVSILNSTTNKTTELAELHDGELVTIDGEMESVISNTGGSLYNSFNYVFLELATGSNDIVITGNGTFSFTYEAKYL